MDGVTNTHYHSSLELRIDQKQMVESSALSYCFVFYFLLEQVRLFFVGGVLFLYHMVGWRDGQQSTMYC